jgi:8-oxo-dGTP diphosphatase
VKNLMVAVPLEQLQLLEGEDLGLVSPEELRSGSIWSTRLGSLRPVADGLQELMQHEISGQG